jgi:hypothetical protein
MGESGINRQIAENTRQACLEAAIRAYEEAKLRGMCLDGAWEYALDAIRDLELNKHEDPD